MSFTFMRWLRTGMAASLESQPQNPPSSARSEISLGVEVAAGGIAQTQVGTVNLDVLGPRDVTGIDPRQVIREFPVRGTLDFEPGYFVHVEFDRPDLPWLFTPHGVASDGSLRPWICLIVVEKGEHAKLEPTLPLPKLTVEPPEVAKLPNPGEAAAWAHVQITGDPNNGAEAITANEPERILSRLVCRRALDANRSYLACVVPIFKAGAIAGLDQPMPATVPGGYAWSGADPKVELPVYHHWELSTGGAGDFRSLVLRLEPRDDLPGVGTRDLDVTEPGFGLEDRAQETIIDLGGALRVAEPEEPPVDAGLAADVESAINVTDAVAPAIYGRWHAAADGVSGAGGSPLGWLEALNLDQRHRVAAGVGTLVVQERQEDLMAAAWEQLGEVLRANQLLRQAQLAVAASERVLARHLAPLPDEVLLSLVGPALTRIRLAPNNTLRRAVAESCLPVLALSGAFRRVVRAHGPLDRRLARRALTTIPDLPPPPRLDATSIIRAFADGALAADPIRMPDGAVALPTGGRAHWHEVTVPWNLPRWEIEIAPGRGREAIAGRRAPVERDRGPDSDPLAELGPTLATLQARASRATCTPLPVGPVADTVRAAIAPDVAVVARARRQIKVPRSTRLRLSSRLDPIMAAPEIPTPMIGPLLELGREWLLPGIGEMPPNTVAIVEPNPEFIEAYMVGLNHEMGRELLWRGFPTDQRGTVFSVFWDRRGSVATGNVAVPERDLPPIHQWSRKTELGDSLARGSRSLVVLLLRGDLLARYPRPTIYMQRGAWKRGRPGGDVVFEEDLGVRSPVSVVGEQDWADNTRFPIFSGDAGEDVSFLGFPLPKEEVRGIDRGEAAPDTSDDDAGWYVVFQEQPTEPRFGGAVPSTVTDADELAAALLRPAFRLFVHASDLVPA